MIKQLLLGFVIFAALIGAGNRVVNRGAAPAPVSVSDDFNRSNSSSLGADWTEANGDMEVFSNTISNVSTSTWVHIAHNTSLNTVTQYGKITLISENLTVGAAGHGGLVLRYTNASSPFYLVSVNSYGGTLDWSVVDDATHASSSTVQSTSTSFASGDTLAVAVSGTGTSTVVRVWKNATGNAPDSGGTTWNSASPDHTFTNDPSTAVNTGSLLGVAHYSHAGNGWRLDNFYGGDVP